MCVLGIMLFVAMYVALNSNVLLRIQKVNLLLLLHNACKPHL